MGMDKRVKKPGTITRTGVAIGVILLLAAQAGAQRQMENLGRGVIAINQGGGKVYVGWRMLGTDPDDIAFNLYRVTGGADPVRLNPEPIATSTNFVDNNARLDQATAYFVRPVLNGQEQPPSVPFRLAANLPARPYLSIPLRTPPGYSSNDASVGDLDGDGEYEVVLHQAGRARDNAHPGPTDEPILEAYKLDGTFLWRINLGKNIREGAHYTQFMVYDLDGDGKAEVVCKTADGTVDGVRTRECPDRRSLTGPKKTHFRQRLECAIPAEDVHTGLSQILEARNTRDSWGFCTDSAISA